MADEDLVRLRRSLAMAPRLPPAEVEALLDEVARLRALRRDLARDLDDLRDQVESLVRRASPGK